jgi:hypothetical protein
MPTDLSAFTRDTLFTMGHALFPYLQASISLEYLTEKDLIRAPILNGLGLSQYFEIGSNSYEIMNFEFHRTNKPPDIPGILKQWTQVNSRILVNHSVVAQAPIVNPSSGSTTYIVSGSATYVVTNGGELVEKEFYYPRSPTDASTQFPVTSEKLGSDKKFYTSTVYRWKAEQKIVLPANALEKFNAGANPVNNPNAPPNLNGG